MSVFEKLFSRNNTRQTTFTLSRDELGRWTFIVVAIITLIGAIGFAIELVFSASWQFYAIGAFFGLTAIVSLIMLTQGGTLDIGIRIFISTSLLQIALIFFAASTSDVWIAAAIFTLIVSIFVSSDIFTGRLSNIGYATGLITSLFVAVGGIFSPIDQISVPLAVSLSYVILALIIVLYVFLLFSGLIKANLRIKFITIFFVVALIPLIVLSFLQANFLQNAIKNQTNTALKLAAQQSATAIDNFITTNLTTVSGQAALSVFSNYLNLNESARPGSPEALNVVRAISVLSMNGSSYSPDYSIFDSSGNVAYSTIVSASLASVSDTDYFSQAIQTGSAYVSPIEFSAANGNAYIYFSAPIRDSENQIIGVFSMRYDGLKLESILNTYAGLISSRSYPILIDENFVRIADTLTPNLLYKSVVPLSSTKLTELQSESRLPAFSSDQLSTNLPDFQSAIQNFALNPYFTTNLSSGTSSNQVSGIVVKVSTQPWYLAYVEDQASIAAISQQQNRLSSLVAILIAGLVGILGTVIATVLSNPIVGLTATVEDVAKGNLSAHAQVNTRDEIETLADSFNTMTTQLSGLVADLEERVRERTHALEKQNETLQSRTSQLQTISEVARAVASAQDLQKLLETLVNLMSERFGFYHVGIFLLDEQHEYAVLRASNSEGGKRMLARQHKLRIGQVGIVGNVTGTGKARIATDVGQDAVYFSNPDLPLTRSEMTLPLIVSDHIIGALDVQSTQANAYTQNDIEVFDILADQVAIAIYNNQLYQDTRQALLDTENLHKQYLQREWSSEVEGRGKIGFLFTPIGLSQIEITDLPEIEKALMDGVSVVTSLDDQIEGEAEVKPSLTVPITLRGETIGVIRLQDEIEKRQNWTEQEIASVKTVADQVGIALENARLLEQTMRRADRERKVLEITSKIRSAADPQAMIKTAVEELQKALHASKAQFIIEQPRKPDTEQKPIDNDHTS
jgi:GAF domain-containing protein/HAMP domain-containing protein